MEDGLALMDKAEVLQRLRLVEQQLAVEKQRNTELEAHLRAERSQRVQVHHQVEEEEEYIVNKVVERLESLKHAKNLGQVAELENMASTLKCRLEQIHTRKLVLERQLELESQYVMGDLQTQLELIQKEKANLATEKAALENALEAEQEFMMHKLQRQLIEMQNDKKALLNDKSRLQRAVHDLAGSVKQLSQDKVDLEQTLEMEEEAFVNKLMRQLLLVMNNYKRMERMLESNGLRMSWSQEGSPGPHRSVPDRSISANNHSGSLCSSPAATPFIVPSSSVGATTDNSRRDRNPREMRFNASLHSMGLNTSFGLARRQDSSSSLGSGASAMSRDVSVSRDSHASFARDPSTAPV